MKYDDNENGVSCFIPHNIRNMNKITNRIKSVVQWYGANWKHPLWIFILLALLTIPCLLLMSGNWHDAFFTELFSVMILLQVIHIGLAGITGIIILCHRKIGRSMPPTDMLRFGHFYGMRHFFLCHDFDGNGSRFYDGFC